MRPPRKAAPAGDGFAGFRPAAFAFFRDLAANQTKAWFEANRAAYEQEVRLPGMAVAEAVAAAYAAHDLPLTGDAKRSLFRINRDVRFSKDKAPYKTHAGIVWMRPGFKKESAGIAYLHIADEGCFFGGGFWQVERPELDAIREEIRAEPAAFTAAIGSAAAAGLVLDTSDGMTRLPRGFEDVADPAILPAIKSRNLVLKLPLAKREMGSAALVQRVVAATEAMMPLLRFGWDAIAAAGPPPEWSLLDPLRTKG